MRESRFADGLVQDVRFASRQFVKRPGFVATAIVTLALGLCASVTIFAFVEATLLRPLPYTSPARLVGVYETTPQFPQSNLSYLDYLDWKRLNRSFSSLAAYQSSRVTLATPTGAEPVPGARVSDDFFRALGVMPILGRDFRAGEDLPAAAPTLILSHAAWQTRYGGAHDVLGRAVTVNGAPATIVGVLPASFHFSPVGAAEFWTTLRGTNPCERRRSCHNLYGVARLNDGVSIEAAAADVVTIAKQLELQYPDSNRDQGAAVVALSDVIVGRVRPILMLLFAGAGLLLVIAAVNVSSLLLIRSEGRRREMAVRFALGASTARVVRQFVTEALMLVALSAALGLAAAHWTIRLLLTLIPANLLSAMSYLQGVGLTGRALAFGAVVALAGAAVFAGIPVMHVFRSNERAALADGTRGSAGTTWRRVGSRLVVLEIATAMVLLVGGGLLGRSLSRLLQVEIGLHADHLASLNVSVPASTYATDERRAALGREIVDRMSALPGVRSVGLTSTPPLQGGNTVWIRVAGRPYNGEHNEVHYREISPGYFATLRARLVKGRFFTDDDDRSRPAVVVVNRALAAHYFGSEDPIGRHLLYAPTTTQPPMEIVGIVDDVKESPLDVATPPTMYVAFAQDPATGFSIVVRTSQSEEAVLPTMTAAVREIDRGITAFAGRTMRQIVDNSPAAYLRRSAAWLVGGFAVLAWILGVIGLYGVVAYSVSQRTREIGVRMALGARRGTVYGLILGEAGKLAAAGVGVGLVCSVFAGSLIRSLLFGVGVWDVPTLAGVAAVLAISALLASFVPARRAASISPIEALRVE